MADRIITIGRQCGSGGHTIGRLLARRLGLAFYDKEIVELTAAKTKFSPEFIQSHGEYFHSGALGHIIGYGTRFDGSYKTGSSLTDQLHQARARSSWRWQPRAPASSWAAARTMCWRGNTPP